MSHEWPVPVREILESNPNAYGELVSTAGGTPADARALLARVTSADQLFAGAPVKSRVAADGVLAGLWLWHDGLDECHRIVQAGESGTLAFWHAIMHRREGDFSNAKYWYARCREHPVRNEVGDANALVDLASRVHDQPADPRFAEAVRMQKAEWQALFEHCLREALG
jgi:hypothetical protein